MTRDPLKPPLSHRFEVGLLRDGPKTVTVAASPEEAAALAEAWGIPRVEALSATVRVAAEGRDRVHVTGRVDGRVWQTCVITLDDFPVALDAAVDVRFAPEAEVEALQAARAAHPAQYEDEPEDVPDPIVNGRIDLGALVAEIAALSLDPYPKKPGVQFEEPAPENEDRTVSPFAALGALKRPDPDGV